MKRVGNVFSLLFCAALVVFGTLFISGCGLAEQAQEKKTGSPIEGISDEVYARGLAFIEKLDANKMVGEAEGEEQLNAVAGDDATDTEALFEDDLYILWVYHNLKSIDEAAEQINERRRKAGNEQTIQESYEELKQNILEAKSEEDLWDIWNSIKEKPNG